MAFVMGCNRVPAPPARTIPFQFFILLYGTKTLLVRQISARYDGDESWSLIVAVPNLKSWDAQYYKQYWAAWDVPIHLWHFSKESIEALFKKWDFKLVKTKPMLFDSFYVSVLSEEYKTGRKNLLKGFFMGLTSNVIALFGNNGYSSTIYVFQKKLKRN